MQETYTVQVDVIITSKIYWIDTRLFKWYIII